MKSIKDNKILIKVEENDIDKKFGYLLNNKIIEQNIIKNSLKKDILDYQKFIKNHTKEYNDINQKILEKIQKNINQINSDYKAKMYGSRATNLCLMWSDIDIVIYYKNEDEENIEDNSFLEKLNKILNYDLEFVENIKYLDKAKVPIIKIKTTKAYNNTMVDITLKTKEHFGLKCVELVKKYIEEYEALEPLLFPLKTILKIGELNDPYNGGLSSYALILMIVNFLEIEKGKNKNITLEKIGDLFYDFLFYYGGRKDSNYIDINNKKNNNEISNNCIFYICDPLNENNNVAKASFKFIEVKLIFLFSLQIINEPCYCQCHYIKNFEDKNFEHNFLNKIYYGLKRGKSNFNNIIN